MILHIYHVRIDEIQYQATAQVLEFVLHHLLLFGIDCHLTLYTARNSWQAERRQIASLGLASSCRVDVSRHDRVGSFTGAGNREVNCDSQPFFRGI